MAAIDRIEVLRDGASAIYGTDAIGGVINFILRRDYQGIAVQAERQSVQADGGGDVTRANVVAGWGSLDKQGWNVMGVIDWRKQKVLEAKDRDFAKTGVLGPTRNDLSAGTSGTAFPGDVGGFEPSGRTAPPRVRCREQMPRARLSKAAATTSRATSTSFRTTSK